MGALLGIRQPVHGINDTPLVLEVGIDITDRKRVEDEFRQGEERFKRLLTSPMTGNIGWGTMAA